MAAMMKQQFNWMASRLKGITHEPLSTLDTVEAAVSDKPLAVQSGNTPGRASLRGTQLGFREGDGQVGALPKSIPELRVEPAALQKY